MPSTLFQRTATRVEEMPIEYLEPNPFQYRSIDPETLDDLVASIREHGFIGSLEVRPANPDPDDMTRALDGRYQIVDGARRLEAAKRAGLTKLPVRRVWRDDTEMELLCYLTNSTVKPATYWEEAQYFKRLQDRGWSMSQIAEAIGKPKSYVQLRLDVLRNRNSAVLEAAREGRIELSAAALFPYLPEDECARLFARLQAGELTYSDLKRYRKALNLSRDHQDRAVWTVPVAEEPPTPLPEPAIEPPAIVGPATMRLLRQELDRVPAGSGAGESSPDEASRSESSSQRGPITIDNSYRVQFSKRTAADHARLLLTQLSAAVPALEERLAKADLAALNHEERRTLAAFDERLRAIAVQIG